MNGSPVAPQQRSYSWTPHDPERPPWLGRSGLEYFQALIDGTLAEQPITSTIGWTFEAVETGYLRLRCDASPWLFHGGGLVHGGAIATLLDSTASGAVLSACAAGQASATTQLSINFVRSIRPGDGPLVAEGRVVSMGRRAAVGTSTIMDTNGRLYAQATATCLIMTG